MHTSQAMATRQPSSLMPMVIIGTLFFIFGFITWLNGSLLPFLKIVCELTEIQAMFITFSFYIAYTVMAFPMSLILDKVGYRRSMTLGLCLIAMGCLLFIPAAQTHWFLVFLLGQFVIGSGLTILQTASNPYIVKIGPQESAAVRISIMGILNKLAGVVAPLLFTALVLGEFSGVNEKTINALNETEKAEQIAQLANGLVMPYLGLAIALFVLAFVFSKSGLPELDLSDETHAAETENKRSVMEFPHLLLGVATLFIYVGVEVIAGDTIGLFGSQLGVANATALTSYTMAFMVLGYVLGLALIPRVINQRQALGASAVLGVMLSLAVVYSSHESHAVASLLWGWTGIATVPDTITFVALLGLANAIVWPAVWPLALAGLGNFTAKGSALLIMGIAGGALLPFVYGALASSLGNQAAYWMMLPCYLFILFYAVKGCQMRK